MLRAVRTTFAPQRVVALATPGVQVGPIGLLKDKTPGPNGARAYVCRNWTCQAPVEDVAALRSELGAPIAAG
jgi:uncharacterized protein YyaL (SSP411 family)